MLLFGAQNASPKWSNAARNFKDGLKKAAYGCTNLVWGCLGRARHHFATIFRQNMSIFGKCSSNGDVHVATKITGKQRHYGIVFPASSSSAQSSIAFCLETRHRILLQTSALRMGVNCADMMNRLHLLPWAILHARRSFLLGSGSPPL